MSTQSLSISCAVLAIASLSLPVQAQQFRPDLEEIVVTAQKREQAVTDISIAIDVLDGDELRQRGATSLIDIAQYSPGVNIRGPFGDFSYPLISLRGVNTDGFIETISQSTGVYTDGVFISSSPMLALRIVDVERIEILKGPQGTLYGRNTIAGAVNLISRKPTFEPDGYLTAGYGNYGRHLLEAAYGAALSEDMAARAAVKFVRQTDGPLRNLNPDVGDGGEIDQLFGRVSLLYRPSDGFEAAFEVHSGRDNSDVWPFALIPAGADTDNDGTLDRLCDEFLSGNIFAAQTNCFASDPFASGTDYNDADGDPYTNDLNAIGANESRSVGFSLSLNWELGNSNLATLTAWDDFERDDAVDEDAGPLSVLGTRRGSDISQFSQEVRLSSKASASTQWLAGIYYSTDEMAGNPAFTNASGRSDFNSLETDTLGLFGQIEYPLSEVISLTLGGRFTEVDRDLYYMTTAGAPFVAPELKAGTTVGFGDEDYSLKIALDYRPNDDTLIYGSISRGFNAGTFNSQFINNLTALQPTKSESIMAYETGVKLFFADNRANIEAAAFYYDYDDIQLVAVEPNDVIASNRLINASGASVHGIEAQLRAAPSDWLDINLGIAHIQSELDSVVVRVSGTGTASPFPYNAPVFGATSLDISGNPLPNHPDLSVNGSIRLNGRVADNWDGFAQLDILWEDDIPRDLLGTKALLTEAHWNLDARLGLESKDGGWRVTVWGRNLTDEVYLTEAYEVLGFGYFIAAGNFSYPRTYGLSVTRNFQGR